MEELKNGLGLSVMDVDQLFVEDIEKCLILVVLNQDIFPPGFAQHADLEWVLIIIKNFGKFIHINLITFLIVHYYKNKFYIIYRCG